MKSAPSWIGLATGFRGFKSPSWRGIRRIRTIGWHDVACVHGVLVFDEAETIHNLDFGNLSGAMGGKEGLNIGLGSCRQRVSGLATWCDRAMSMDHCEEGSPSRAGWPRPQS
jgi:hypothetical protein